MVQLREHEHAGGRAAGRWRAASSAITRGKALLIINDRVDVAEAVEADGVQMPGGRPADARGARPSSAVRRRWAAASTTSRRRQQATRDGADFVIAGTIYKSASKPEPEAGRRRPDQRDHEGHHAAGARHRRHHGGEGRRRDQGGRGGCRRHLGDRGGRRTRKAAAEELTKALKDAWASREAVAASA